MSAPSPSDLRAEFRLSDAVADYWRAMDERTPSYYGQERRQPAGDIDRWTS